MLSQAVQPPAEEPAIIRKIHDNAYHNTEMHLKITVFLRFCSPLPSCKAEQVLQVLILLNINLSISIPKVLMRSGIFCFIKYSRE